MSFGMLSALFNLSPDRRQWDSPQQLALLAVLANYHNDKFGYAFPGIETIAGHLKVSDRHTMRLIQEVRQLGLVQVTKGGRGGNRYLLLHPSQQPGKGDAGVTISAEYDPAGVGVGEGGGPPLFAHDTGVRLAGHGRHATPDINERKPDAGVTSHLTHVSPELVRTPFEPRSVPVPLEHVQEQRFAHVCSSKQKEGEESEHIRRRLNAIADEVIARQPDLSDKDGLLHEIRRQALDVERLDCSMPEISDTLARRLALAQVRHFICRRVS
jgi:hypothetical protein